MPIPPSSPHSHWLVFTYGVYDYLREVLDIFQYTSSIEDIHHGMRRIHEVY